jgi:hypothetical protein
MREMYSEQPCMYNTLKKLCLWRRVFFSSTSWRLMKSYGYLLLFCVLLKSTHDCILPPSVFPKRLKAGWLTLNGVLISWGEVGDACYVLQRLINLLLAGRVRTLVYPCRLLWFFPAGRPCPGQNGGIFVFVFNTWPVRLPAQLRGSANL